MVKTESEIERDFFMLVKASALGAALRGSVYRSEMRPADAATEDAVIKFLAGLDGQVQTGTVILNVYVPDVAHGPMGRAVADKARAAELQSLIRELVGGAADTEYLLEAVSTPTTAEADGIAQHVITARINFKRITL